ncbi:UNVERIFIED_CONTAM: hypothetical protein PYX00_006793 [Menopon gallinae]|uniref:Envelope protein n=1 Tax=Menopon gallinae TaxID=328185 RepID=A0AAW2HY54_9NEOP
MANSCEFSIIILILLLIPTVSSQAVPWPEPYRIQYLNTHSGLYYDYVGRAQIANSKLTFLSQIDISSLFDQQERLETLLDQTKNLCTHKGTTGQYQHVILYCKTSLLNLDIRLNDIKTKSTTIRDLVGEQRRTKRGIFDGVSYALHWLFGIPDASDAQRYESSIKDLFKKNRNVQTLMKQQITIASSVIANFNLSMRHFQMNEEILNNNTIAFNTFSSNVTTALKEIRLQELIVTQIHTLTLLTNLINEDVETILSSILLGKTNIVHSRVLKPSDLLQDLTRAPLPDDLRLPLLPTHENIHKYLNLIKLNIAYIKRTLIFAIEIPFVEGQSFNVYKILPLPTPHNTSNLYSYIKPSHPYILMDIARTGHVLLDDLKSCITVEATEMICSGIASVQTADSESCEATLLAKVVTQIPNNCEIHTVPAIMEAWHELCNKGWLFALTEPTIVTLSCSESRIIYIELVSTGEIHFAEDCRCYTKHRVIKGRKNINMTQPSLSRTLCTTLQTTSAA